MNCLVVMVYKTTIIRTVRYLNEPNRKINRTERPEIDSSLLTLYMIMTAFQIGEQTKLHAETFG